MSKAAVFTCPKALHAASVRSPFGKYYRSGDPIVTNGKSIDIRLRACDLGKLSTPMEELKTLGEWRVKCRRLYGNGIPGSEITYGVIGGIDQDYNLDEFVDGFRIQEPNKDRPTAPCRLLQIYRLPTKFPGPNDPKKSKQLRLMFEGPLPSLICLESGMSYRVYKYKFPIWRCYICQKFGHGSTTCHDTVRCTMCSQHHKFRSAEGTTCSNDPYCYLCGGPHRLVSKDCPLYKRAITINDEGLADNVPRSEIHRQLRQLPTQYRKEKEAEKSRRPSVRDSWNNDTRNSIEDTGTWRETRPPIGNIPQTHAQTLHLQNRYAPLTEQEEEEEVDDVEEMEPCPQTTFAEVVVHAQHSPTTQRAQTRRPQRASNRQQHRAGSPTRSRPSHQPSQSIRAEESEEPPRTPASSPTQHTRPFITPRPTGPATAPNTVTIDLPGLIHILIDAFTSYMSGVSPQDICARLIPRLLDLCP